MLKLVLLILAQHLSHFNFLLLPDLQRHYRRILMSLILRATPLQPIGALDNPVSTDPLPAFL